MRKQKYRLAFEVFVVVCFSIGLVVEALSLPKLLAAHNRFELFLSILKLIVFPVMLYLITPRLRSRLFSRKPTTNSHRNADEAQNVSNSAA